MFYQIEVLAGQISASVLFYTHYHRICFNMLILAPIISLVALAYIELHMRLTSGQIKTIEK